MNRLATAFRCFGGRVQRPEGIRAELAWLELTLPLLEKHTKQQPTSRSSVVRWTEADLAVPTAAVRGGPQSPSSFLNAGPISEAVNLYAVALRTGKKLLYDGGSQKITNLAEANKYLIREYRKNWDPKSI